jgi:predicted membrane chloride channel (bestrophin family)
MTRRIGWGPFVYGLWPAWLYRLAFYDPRPDLLKSKTYPQQWIMLKSEMRWLQSLFHYLGPPSHILYNIRYPIAIILLLDIAVVVWRGISPGTFPSALEDREQTVKLGFQLSSFSISVLLGYKVQKGFERWRDALAALTGVGGAAWGLFQMAATYPSISKDEDLLSEYRRWCICWPYSVLQITTQAPELDEAAANELFPLEYEVYKAAPKGRQLVVQKLRSLVSRSSLSTAEFTAMTEMIEKGVSNQGSAIRIREQSMPQSIEYCTSGFILIWSFLSPLCISSFPASDSTINWVGAFIIFIMALSLLSVDEATNHLNDPFDLLPGKNIADSNRKDIKRIEQELAAVTRASVDGLAAFKKARDDGTLHSQVVLSVVREC